MSNDLNMINYLEAGLKVESLKQKAIADNVANLNTPGYRRVDLKFEEALAKAMGSTEKFNADEIELEYYNPKNTQVKTNGNDVSLDKEVSEMVKNNLRHSTFIRLLKNKYKMIDRAIRTTG